MKWLGIEGPEERSQGEGSWSLLMHWLFLRQKPVQIQSLELGQWLGLEPKSDHSIINQ